MQEMRVQSLGQEDPLEKEMATHSNILAWEIPWTEEPGGLQAMGRKESIRIEHGLSTHNGPWRYKISHSPCPPKVFSIVTERQKLASFNLNRMFQESN